MFLTGDEIVKKGIINTPVLAERIQPASVDLCFNAREKLLKLQSGYIDLLDEHINWQPVYEIRQSDGALAWGIQPDDFLLASTIEEVEIPLNMVGRVEGKSSLARIGLICHTTAGFIDPGFKGVITLEFKNVGPATIWLHHEQPVCQLSVAKLTKEAVGYSGKYQNATGTEGAKF